jgi:predicted TIM-barrel fold metal-dependent hydrolase
MRLEIPKIISVDDHVVEPPTLWQDRLPGKYKDVAPRVIRSKVAALGSYAEGKVHVTSEEGRPADIWLYEDLRLTLNRPIAAVGFPKEDVTLTPMTFDEMRPGCYDPKARLEDMDVNGVEASVCFPNTFVRFCGQVFSEAKDKDLALLCVKAYNDWMIDEWAGQSGGRLVPLCIIPLWDVDLAVKEVRRVSDLGCHGICFSEIPPYLGLPSIHSGEWNPLFDVCNQTGTVLSMHIGSGSKFPSTSDDAPDGVLNVIGFVNCVMSLTDWLLSGLLKTFQNLKLLYAECQIGWIPYVLERCDTSWTETRGWNNVYERLAEPPSHYYYRNVNAAFFDDAHGIKSIDEVGVDNVLFETDYPHADSTWPRSPAVVERLMADLAAEVVQKIVRTNAIRLFQLER